MHRSKIEWVLNPDNKTLGWVWNPITGCLNGCEYCYARKLANGRLRTRYLANKTVSPYHGERDYMDNRHNPFYPRFWEDKLFDPMKARKTPKGIFICDMADLFGIGVPEVWTDHVMTTIKCCPDHRFYLLTKQRQNLIKFSPFPDNCFVGVTATDHEYFCQVGLALEKVSAKVKYLSIEPFLDWRPCPIDFVASRMNEIGIKWVIIGSQTKPYKPPEISWVEEIVRACDKAGIPVFCKNNLEKICFSLTKSQLDEYSFWETSYTDDEFIVGVDLRQEMPKL